MFMNETSNTNNQIKFGVAYVRESTEEQDKGFSPKNQENAIMEYAQRENIKIVEIYKDLVSGREVKKRDDFKRMMDDAMQRRFEVIVVFHTSRFARNVQEARQYKEKLRKKLKINVISVTQRFGDWEDPSAFLNEGINELFDEHYSKQLGFWVKSGLMEKRRQGKPCGNPPLGYYKRRLGYDEETGAVMYDKKWRTEEKEAELVGRIFEMYASGDYSMAQIANELTLEGLKTKYDNQFTYDSIRGILTNKAYLGIVYSPRRGYQEYQSTIHEPIITKELFDKVQATISDRRRTIGRPSAQHRFYLLQGLVYCHHCKDFIKGRENMDTARMFPKMYCYTNVTKKIEKKYYVCKFKKENKTCSESIECKIIDKQIIKLMGRLVMPDKIIKATVQELKKSLSAVEVSQRDNQELTKLEKTKERLSFLFLNTQELDEIEYMKQLREVNSRIDKIKVETGIEGERLDKQTIIKATEEFLKDFSRRWHKELDDREKRMWISMILKRIWIENDKIVSIEPKVEFQSFLVFNKMTTKWFRR